MDDQCVGSGFCCKQRPCPFGESDETGGCRFLVPWVGDDLDVPRYRCGKYEEISRDPSSHVSPAFGAGCCSPMFNESRDLVLVVFELGVIASQPRKEPDMTTNNRDLYTKITERIIESMWLDGVPPWRRPWSCDSRGSMVPRNGHGRPYRGINAFLLSLVAYERGYGLPVWLTFRQASEIAARALRATGMPLKRRERPGFQQGLWTFVEGPRAGLEVWGVREEENPEYGSGTEVILWRPCTRVEEDPKTGKEKRVRFMLTKSFNVFNVEQCIPEVKRYIVERETEAFTDAGGFEVAESICNGFECVVDHKGTRAFYTPATDEITLPEKRKFKSPEHYYCTRFHEMGHATGAKHRLDRKGIVDFDFRGSHQYSEEELIAEFTACFLAAEAGIEQKTEKSSVSYLKSWSSKLKDDPKLIVYAAQRAQKAADFILGRTFENEEGGRGSGMTRASTGVWCAGRIPQPSNLLRFEQRKVDGHVRKVGVVVRPALETLRGRYSSEPGSDTRNNRKEGEACA